MQLLLVLLWNAQSFYLLLAFLVTALDPLKEPDLRADLRDLSSPVFACMCVAVCTHSHLCSPLQAPSSLFLSSQPVRQNGPSVGLGNMSGLAEAAVPVIICHWPLMRRWNKVLALFFFSRRSEGRHDRSRFGKRPLRVVSIS